MHCVFRTYSKSKANCHLDQHLPILPIHPPILFLCLEGFKNNNKKRLSLQKMRSYIFPFCIWLNLLSRDIFQVNPCYHKVQDSHSFILIFIFSLTISLSFVWNRDSHCSLDWPRTLSLKHQSSVFHILTMIFLCVYIHVCLCTKLSVFSAPVQP